MNRLIDIVSCVVSTLWIAIARLVAAVIASIVLIMALPWSIVIATKNGLPTKQVLAETMESI